jgi:hypothetical protein
MTDVSNSATPKLQRYFSEYGPTRFTKPDGQPVGRRSLQKKIKQFNLPIINTGWDPLIDPVEGDEQLAKYARRPPDRETRGRGRPRKDHAAGSGAASSRK